ncbi:hypothetical protein [Nostoc sp. 106C]|uniref:hypothetical protein n=1 Tax=Nostoc sp. 106C TaxID=1932667 RepID=UPI0026D74FBC
MIAVAEVYQTDIGKVKLGQQTVITGQYATLKAMGYSDRIIYMEDGQSKSDDIDVARKM